jgi:exo-beta-1,3-glucanase (GH17 family)
MADLTSTMDVVMSPEERAEMEAAAEQGDPAAQEALKSTESSTATPSSAAETASTTPEPTVTSDANSAGPSNSSLAHHSSFGASASGSTNDISRKGVQAGKDKKGGRLKFTPEQRAQLEALETKKDEEKKARSVQSVCVDLLR